MIITFERTHLADVDTLVDVQVRAFHDDARLYPGVELGGPPGYDSPDALREKLSEEDYYTIRADGRIIGGMGIYNMAQGHYHLDVIYIDPAFHNRGIGSQAITFMEQTYPSATRWTLNTPAYAVRNHHFYEKFGYRKVGESTLDDGFLLYDYEKRL